VNKVEDQNIRAIAALLQVDNVGNHITHDNLECFLTWVKGDKQILNLVYSICCQKWFWGPMTLAQATIALSQDKNNTVGTYLVRWESNNWHITYVARNSNTLQVINEPLKMHKDKSVRSLMEHMIIHLMKHSKKFKEPACYRPIQFSSIEVKSKWLTGGKGGNYEVAAGSALVGHYEFLV